jgi:hypothetical protein
VRAEAISGECVCALELTQAGADAQPVVRDSVAVDKDVYFYLQVHHLAERKVVSAWRCKRLDEMCAVLRCDGVRHQLEILT